MFTAPDSALETAGRAAWVLLLLLLSLLPALLVLRGALLDASPPSPAAAGESAEAWRLRQDIGYWTARLDGARSGGSVLALDLVDSLATLEIRGVAVRRCRLTGIRDTGGTAGSDRAIDRPFAIGEGWATLPKEPVRVEIAPRDSAEYRRQGPRTFVPLVEDAEFEVALAGGPRIRFLQREPMARAARRESQRRRWRARTESAAAMLRDLLGGEPATAEPRIDVELSRDDSRAIYRALGPDAAVCLRF